MSAVENFMNLIDKFNRFLELMPIDQLIKEISEETGKERKEVDDILKLYVNEARAALFFVEPLLARNIRILEVGAGICVLSLFLKEEGFDIIALEPALAGFGFFNGLKKIVVRHYNEINLTILSYPADELREERVGSFDLIFSFNVIEHIPSPFSTLLVLMSVLKNKGQMAHSCPNYLVPYEPHFGVPVLAIWPNLSKFLFKRKISGREELWNSLNFITYLEIKQFAAQHKFAVHFEKGLLYDALDRVEKDPIFGKRQKNFWVELLLIITRCFGGIRQLKKLPPCCATPMIFFIYKRDS
jgi:2-polyprenyl-3-methyl-5-hydroxy-6-metoxy-1,4-benzoquinol methylase